jgi:hypothetical protein
MRGDVVTSIVLLSVIDSFSKEMVDYSLEMQSMDMPAFLLIQ